MKRALAIAILLGLFLTQMGCESHGGTDPKKRQQKISIDVD
ncbi:MAG TPA: hypothetical protein VL282_14340 [Tepidisphaeraceae bacterium]|jgi:hypothetical protein|nr:hypothetical protein [Tepidisphaeraceae bacterium]